MFSATVGPLSPGLRHLIDATGVGNFDELYALTRQFPSLALDGAISLPAVSFWAAMRASRMTVRAVADVAAPPARRFATGAWLSPETSFMRGLPVPAAMPQSGMGRAVGVVISHTSSFPVVDQGSRGTCVAHAAVASAEPLYLQKLLSPQFLYWAAKRHGGDPVPEGDGTWLSCAGAAMHGMGVCEEPYWPYAPQTILTNATHERAGHSPSASALVDAGQRKRAVAFYKDSGKLPGRKAAALAQQLVCGPVAISLPVFMELTTSATNWHWYGATNYGHVLDPVPNSVLVACHAVCVFSYQPTPLANGGGWFIFKNSWGCKDWSNGGAQAPAGDPALAPGYGYLSAAYVDIYLQELLRV